jgi:membrane associated rhomboid family serine protease
VRSHYLYNFAATMTDTSATPSDRLHAVVHMEWMLWDNPNKRKVVSVLTNLVKGQRPSMGEMLHVELTMTGERILCWFTPAEMDQHRPYFSLVYVIFILTTFFFMAGDFALYAHTVSPSYRLQHGPQRLVAWLSPDSDLAFSFDYLREWGSRYAPDIADGEWYRWVTSVFIHASFLHMLSNLLLTLVLSMHLETKYGAWRIALVWVISCGGGQLVSAAAEDPCGQFVGSSGGVFGMMGLFIADMIVNFHTISRPILRCLLILLFIAFFVITIVRDVSPLCPARYPLPCVHKHTHTHTHTTTTTTPSHSHIDIPLRKC